MLEIDWLCFCAASVFFVFFWSYVFIEIRASTVDHLIPPLCAWNPACRHRKETLKVDVNARG